MQIAANKSRLLTALSSNAGFAGTERLVGRNGLLQQIVLERLTGIANSQQAFIKIANHLIHAAEHAYSFRDADTIEEASAVLMRLPVENVRQVGLYYHALALNREGQIDKAKALLEKVVNEAPFAYRVRAIQTLGTIQHKQNQFGEAQRLYLEALRVSSRKYEECLLATLMAYLDISFVKSVEGDHNAALADLENLSPLVKVVARQQPLYFYLYHADLAFELGEVGRIAEAQDAIAIALASPFAPAYPEWSETRDEIAAKQQTASPSVVFITRDLNSDASTQAQPRRMLVSGWPAPEKTFSNAPTSVDGSASASLTSVTRTILDRLDVSIRPRAPPSLYL
jgi:tetratricopeptide (TPR) repeat protein